MFTTGGVKPQPKAGSSLSKTTLTSAQAAAHLALGLLLAPNAAPLDTAARSELEEGLRLDPQLQAALPPAAARELDSLRVN
jgi:hypothetical protein